MSKAKPQVKIYLRRKLLSSRKKREKNQQETKFKEHLKSSQLRKMMNPRKKLLKAK